jgi:hypothetical protein
MSQLSLIEATKSLEPDDNSPIFKFTSVGDVIDAKFVGRRRGIKTKQGDAIALDVDILDSIVVGDRPVTGRASVFESGHITQIFDRENLSPGDRFVLRLHSVDRKSRFKKFFFKKAESLAANGGDDDPFDDVPPPWAEEEQERAARRG